MSTANQASQSMSKRVKVEVHAVMPSFIGGAVRIRGIEYGFTIKTVDAKFVNEDENSACLIPHHCMKRRNYPLSHFEIILGNQERFDSLIHECTHLGQFITEDYTSRSRLKFCRTEQMEIGAYVTARVASSALSLI